jgi:hypothetical protein
VEVDTVSNNAVPETLARIHSMIDTRAAA